MIKLKQLLQHYTAFDDKAKYKVKDKRYGLRLRCKKCGRKIKFGGFKSRRQLDQCFTEFDDKHKQTCDGRLIIEHDFHAAEIPHTYVEQTTQQTETSATYTDVTGASIGSGSFTTGRKYLILITSQFATDSNAAEIAVQTLHGSTVFPDSESGYKPNAANHFHMYVYNTVWTAISSEGIKLQMKESSTATAKIDQIAMTSIEISEDLSENIDWFQDTDSVDTSANPTNEDGASITLTPAGASDWLVISLARFSTITNNNELGSRINAAGDVTSTEPQSDIRMNNPTFDFRTQCIARVYSLTNQSNTFKEQATATGGPIRTDSFIFALNLNKFKDHAFLFTSADSNIGGLTGFDIDHVTMSTQSMTPSQTGDVMVGGFGKKSSTSRFRAHVRLQIDGSDTMPTQTSDDYNIGRTSSTTALATTFFMNSIENLDDTSHTLDMDGWTASSSVAYAERSIWLVTMELAAIAARRRTPQIPRSLRY